LVVKYCFRFIQNIAVDLYQIETPHNELRGRTIAPPTYKSSDIDFRDEKYLYIRLSKFTF